MASKKQVYVFLGRTGAGKSASCNTLLGEKKFKCSVGMGSETQECDWGEFRHPSTGATIKVIDTPGVFDTGRDTEEMLDEIGKCMGIALTDSDGIDAFILVLKIGDRFTEEHTNSVKLLLRTFGEDMVSHVMVLFTRARDLDTDLQDYLHDKSVPEFLTRFLHRCSNRVVAIENKGADAKQVSDVVREVDRMREINYYKPFNNQVVMKVKEIIVIDRGYYSSVILHTRAIVTRKSRAVSLLSNLFGNLILVGTAYLKGPVDLQVAVSYALVASKVLAIYQSKPW